MINKLKESFMELRKTKIKKCLTLFMSLLMVFGMIHIMTGSGIVVKAEGSTNIEDVSYPALTEIPWEAPTVNEINIGSASLYAIPGGWNNADGVKVWFGQYGSVITTFRVLEASEDTMSVAYNSILLDCDTVLSSSYMSYNQSNSNKWENCNIRTFLRGDEYYSSNNVFSSIEKSAILETTLKNVDEYIVNSGSYIDYESTDYAFLLSAKEMNELYEDDASRIKWDYTGNGAHCWLRSTDADSSENVATVFSPGNIEKYNYNNPYIRVSPALNLNRSLVLFTSINGPVKSNAITQETDKIASVNNREWKLTLLDNGKRVKVTDNENAIKSTDGTITVPYTYTDVATTDAEKVNQISVMITDKSYTESDANILYYGALQNIKDADGNSSTVVNSATGTGTLELPSELNDKVMGTDYYVYIIAEHTTDTRTTDYASAPVEIDIYERINRVAIEIDEPQAGEMLDTTVSCETTGVSGAASSVIWTPADTTAGYMTSYKAIVELGAEAGFEFNENTTATINGNEADVSYDGNTGKLTVGYTFDTTGKDKLTSITAPQSIIVDNGTTYGDMGLPTTVTIVTEGNTVTTADVTWITTTPASGSYDPAILTEQTVVLNGSVTCPANIEANGVELKTTISITISAAGIVGAPTVNPLAGTYTENQTVVLTTTTDGATIYYTTDGTTPSKTNGIAYTTPITISGVAGQSVKTTIKTIAVNEGMQDSEMKTFEYTIKLLNTNPNPVPDTTPPVYEIIEGEDATWTPGSDEEMTIKGDGDFSKFVGVKVDGNFIDAKNYIAEDNLTTITLDLKYLSSLSVGTHTLEIVWEDGSDSTNFTINEITKDDSPNAGDTSNPLWFILFTVSGVGILITVDRKFRRHYE